MTDTWNRCTIPVAVLGALVGFASCAADPNDDPALQAQATVLIPSSTTAALGAPPPVAYVANGEVISIQALDNTFRRDAVEIVAGTEVRWQNRGRNNHNIVPLVEAEWGVADPAQFPPKESYSYVFTTSGTYPYYCTIHGTSNKGMVGTITVTAP